MELYEKIERNKEILESISRKLINLEKQKEDLILKIENQEIQLKNLQRKKAQAEGSTEVETSH